MAVVLLLWLTMGGRMHETDPYNSSEILPILEESPILNTIPGREAGLQIPAENAIEPESEGNAIAPAESQHQAEEDPRTPNQQSNNNVQNAIQQGQQNAGSIPVQPIQNNVQNAIQQGQQNAGNTPHPGINHPGANVDQPTQLAGL